MINVNVIKLEDDKEYLIIDVLKVLDNNYLILATEKYDIADNDIRVRRVINQDGKDYLVKLDSEEELKSVLKAFYDKHNGKGENIE